MSDLTHLAAQVRSIGRRGGPARARVAETDRAARAVAARVPHSGGAQVLAAVQSAQRELSRIDTDLAEFAAKADRFADRLAGVRGTGGASMAGAPVAGMPGLHAHESWPGAPGGHTLAKHVGLTETQLAERLAQEPSRAIVSTFTDVASAETAVNTVLHAHAGEISRWLAGSAAKSPRLSSGMQWSSGRYRRRGDLVSSAGHTASVVLRRDPSKPQGYVVLTAFVEP